MRPTIDELIAAREDLAYVHGAKFGMRAAESPEAAEKVRKIVERRSAEALAVLRQR